jgi:hypothetical protein
MKLYDKTHRCEGSLAHGVSIRRSTLDIPFTGEWSACFLDRTWGDVGCGGVYQLKYCPWCGAKLDKRINMEEV